MQTAFASKIRYRGTSFVVLAQTRERWSNEMGSSGLISSSLEIAFFLRKVWRNHYSRFTNLLTTLEASSDASKDTVPPGVITKPVLGVIANKGCLNRRNDRCSTKFAARELVCPRDFCIKGKVSRRHGHFPPLFCAIFSYRRNVKANTLGGLPLKFEYAVSVYAKCFSIGILLYIDRMQVDRSRV